MIDRSIDSLIVKSIVQVIFFHFVSSRYIRILLYKVSQVLENVFLLNKNRKRGWKSQQTSQNNGSVLQKKSNVVASSSSSCFEEIYLGDRLQICRKHAVSLSKFILLAIFRDEFHCLNQCLVAFGDCAAGRFQHWNPTVVYMITCRPSSANLCVQCTPAHYPREWV